VRIIYFTRDYTAHDHRFLAALSQTEHRIYFLRLEKRGHTLEDRPLPDRVEQVGWEGGQAPAALKDGWKLLSSLRKVIRKVKPDLIHAGPIQSVALLSTLTGFRPLVSMSWGYDLMYDVNRGWPWRWAARYVLQRSAAFVGDCEAVRQQAVMYGMAPERTVIFPWGVNLQKFTPAADKQAGQTFTVLSTRSWEEIYGVEILAKAFAQAAREAPELNLIMLGNGSLAGRLRQIFGQAGVDTRVFFPGQVRQDDLPRFYRSADLYVSASRTDGTSISLLEALACGCPVAVSDIPGNREWVQEGEQGWLFADGDSDALAAVLVRAVQQRSQLTVMQVAARKLAEQGADWDKNFPKLLHAYELALSSK
jgi:glycosyltransferase involved in cell wall biosynthesis